MPFDIQLATLEDAPTLAIVQREAFAEDAIVKYLSPDVPRDITHERDVTRMSGFFKDSETKGVRITKVVDVSNGYDQLSALVLTSFLLGLGYL